MDRQCVVAVYDSFDKAKSAIIALEASSFPSDQVSLVSQNVEREVPGDVEEEMQFGDESERDAAKGAGVGGLIGALLGAPLLAVPGIGPLLAAGPIATGLTGAIVGGFLGSMAGWGVHKDRVKEYERQVQEGAVLVVATGDPLEVANAREILDDTGATAVDLHAQTSADDVQP